MGKYIYLILNLQKLSLQKSNTFKFRIISEERTPLGFHFGLRLYLVNFSQKEN